MSRHPKKKFKRSRVCEESKQHTLQFFLQLRNDYLTKAKLHRCKKTNQDLNWKSYLATLVVAFCHVLVLIIASRIGCGNFIWSISNPFIINSIIVSESGKTPKKLQFNLKKNKKKKRKKEKKKKKKGGHPMGLEPTIAWLEVRCLIH